MRLEKAQLFSQAIVLLLLHKNSNYKPGLMKIFHPCEEELTEWGALTLRVVSLPQHCRLSLYV